MIFLPHSESTVDGQVGQWGYAYGGAGWEVMAGDGIPAPWGEVKYNAGAIRVGIADGTAAVHVSTWELSVAP